MPITKPKEHAFVAPAIFLFVGSWMVLAPGTVHAVVRGTCIPGTTTSFAVAATPAFAPDRYIDLPGTHINFVQRGSSPGCVLVTFSAEARGYKDIFVAAEIDNSRSLQNEIQFLYYTNEVDHPEVTFIFPNISPGPHSVQIRFRISFYYAEIGRRTTVVYYAP